MSTYAGVVKEIPILPFPAADYLVRGMVVEWNTSQQLVTAWIDETVAPLGVATGDSDTDLGIIDVYCGKGASVQIKCDVGIVPAAGDWLYWSSTGVASNTGTGGRQFATAVGAGMNGMVEAVII